MKRAAVVAVLVLVAVASAGALGVAGDGDGDGVPTVDELLSPTDPFDPDTDGDGLDDRAERATYGTDPADPDTDDDGLSDAPEVQAHGTNPARADSDADGLDDRAEVRDHPTSPARSDTDADGLGDGAEVGGASDPTAADTDGDRLRDGREASLGTDPTDTDTDADGLADGVEVRAGGVLADADPLRKDVFLELDYMRGTAVPSAKLRKVERAFATAPVENPGGSRGIALHVVVSDAPVPSEAKTSLSEYSNSYYRSAFDNRGYGYFHALVVRTVADGDTRGNLVGATSSTIDGMIVEDRPNRVKVAKTVMHELGHGLGLYRNDHRGIDSYDLKPGQYHSVMNYHLLGPCDCNYDYSDGSRGPNDFDDWAAIAASLAQKAPDSSEAAALVEE